jgi:hypothetical protein
VVISHLIFYGLFIILSTIHSRHTTRKVFISDDLLVTLQTLVTEWYVFHEEMSIFVISCM